MLLAGRAARLYEMYSVPEVAWILEEPLRTVQQALAGYGVITGRWPGIGPQHAAARDRGEAYKDMTVRRTRNRRDVWTINTEPYSGAHFATMPEALAEVCIMAGTSERGCCPECGAPWERVTARREPVDTGAQIGGCPDRQDGGRRERDVTGAGGNVPARVRLGTDAWQSGCSCDAGKPVPCTVLDPFAGSGTTVLVADRLGRHGIGVELNEEYCEMARERCYRDAPLLAYAARGEA